MTRHEILNNFKNAPDNEWTKIDLLKINLKSIDYYEQMYNKTGEEYYKKMCLIIKNLTTM